jgi:hypothetical protein
MADSACPNYMLLRIAFPAIGEHNQNCLRLPPETSLGCL